MGPCQSKNLEEIRLLKISERAETIQRDLIMLEQIIRLEKITPEFIDHITRLPLEQIVDQLNNHKVTSKQLTAIYAQRTATIGLKLNLITEVNFAGAIAQAEQCDKIRKSTGKRNWTFKEQQQKMKKYLSPLFGIPTSIKDTFDIKGLSSSVGITNRAFDIKQNDGIIIKALKQGGLIPFTKSNIAQLAMFPDCINYLWGEGQNPWNQERSIGGSSGGEGGLVSARCSPIGLGSDMGGSIRIPAEFCGVYGLKPCDSRLSNNYSTEFSTTFAGMDTFPVVIGPLSNSVEGLALWMKTVTNEQNFKGKQDIYHKNIPFDTKTYKEYQTKKKLRIGYLKSLELIQSTRASQRAIQKTLKILQQLGHQTIPVQIPNETYIARQFYSEYTAQGESLTMKSMLKDEPFIPDLGMINQLSQLNTLIVELIKTFYSKKSPRITFMLEGSSKKTVYEYLHHVGKVVDYRKEFEAYWRQKRLDFMIMPGFGSQAYIHGYGVTTCLAAAYTFIWNVLGATVGSMPITLARREEEFYQSKHNDEVTQKLKQTVKGSTGMPVGIQVIGLPYEDQKVLGFMKSLQKQVQFYKKFPLPKVQ